MATKEEYQKEYNKKKLRLKKLHKNLGERKKGTNVFTKIMDQCDKNDTENKK